MRPVQGFVAAALIAVAGLGVSGVAYAEDYDGNKGCDQSAYGTSGENGVDDDSGCDTTRYENRGSNGNSAPDSYNYGRTTDDSDRPLGEGLFGAL